jgi:hypothetical protein
MSQQVQFFHATIASDPQVACRRCVERLLCSPHGRIAAQALRCPASGQKAKIMMVSGGCIPAA